MYERTLKHREDVHFLRVRQARRNNEERRAMADVIEDCIPYVKPIKFENEMTVRTEHDRVRTFKAVSLRRSEHFPGIVPELVSNDGDYMLITWLTFGSLLRIMNEVRHRAQRVR